MTISKVSRMAENGPNRPDPSGYYQIGLYASERHRESPLIGIFGLSVCQRQVMGHDRQHTESVIPTDSVGRWITEGDATML